MFSYRNFVFEMFVLFFWYFRYVFQKRFHRFPPHFSRHFLDVVRKGAGFYCGIQPPHLAEARGLFAADFERDTPYQTVYCFPISLQATNLACRL